MKKYKKLICVCLAAIQLLFFISCAKEKEQHAHERDYCRINGENIYFLAEEELEALREPLIKLLSNRMEMIQNDGEDMKYVAPDPNSPSVAYGYRCGLFDFTGDGIPELVAEPHGYSGSSAATQYNIYDIHTGEHIDTVHTGDGNICLYYSVEQGAVAIVNAYGTQCGWSEKTRTFVSDIYDSSSGGFVDDFRLSEDYLIYYDDGFGSRILTQSFYSVNGEAADWAGYYAKYDSFINNYIRLPETELDMIWIADLDDENIDRHTLAEKITDLLMSSKQKILIPNKNTVKDFGEELCLTKSN